MEIKPIASGSTGNAYLVSDGKTTLLLDCGVALSEIQKAVGFKTSKIAGCLVTHRHGDHTRGIRDLAKRGVNIYANRDVRGQAENHHRIKLIEPKGRVDIGTFRVVAFDVKHDVPCLGFLIHTKENGGETLCYITDAQYSPYTFKGVTHWIVEANFSEEKTRENLEKGLIDLRYKDRVWHTHMSIEALENMLLHNDLSKTLQIWLAHMSDKNADEEEFKRRIRKITGVEVYAC